MGKSFRWTVGGLRTSRSKAYSRAQAGEAVAFVHEIHGGGCGSSKAAGTVAEQPGKGKEFVETSVVISPGKQQPVSNAKSGATADLKIVERATPVTVKSAGPPPDWMEALMAGMVKNAVDALIEEKKP